MERMDKSKVADVLNLENSFVEWISRESIKTSSVIISPEDIDIEIRRTDLKIKQEELKGQEQDREQRKGFADKIFIMLICFLGATLTIASLTAIENLNFNLSDTVLITLLATTTADIIAIFILVVRYLFKANTCHRCGIKISSKSEVTTNE